MLSRKLYKNLLYMQHSDSLRKASFDQRRIIPFNGFILRIIKVQTVFIRFFFHHLCSSEAMFDDLDFPVDFFSGPLKVKTLKICL